MAENNNSTTILFFIIFLLLLQVQFSVAKPLPYYADNNTLIIDGGAYWEDGIRYERNDTVIPFNYSGYDYAILNNAHKTYYYSQNRGVMVEYDNTAISFTLQSLSVSRSPAYKLNTSKFNLSRIGSKFLFNNTDFNFSLLKANNLIKEEYYLARRPFPSIFWNFVNSDDKLVADYSFNFTNLTVIVDGQTWDGSPKSTKETILLKNENNEVYYEIPPAFANDSNGSIAYFEYYLYNNGSEKRLSINLSLSWLKNATYPVTIDPTVVINDYMTAGVIWRGSPNNDAIESGNDNIGNSGGTCGGVPCYYWLLLKYNTTLINGHTIQSAILNYYITVYQMPGGGFNTSNFSVAIYNVTSNWNNTATWNTQPSNYSIKENSTTLDNKSSRIYSFNITNLAQYWADNPSLNYGFLIRNETGSFLNMTVDGDYLSLNYGTGNLTITLQNNVPTLPTNYTNFTLRTNLTPTITWTKGTDSDGDNVTTYVYLGNNSNNLTYQGEYSNTTAVLGTNLTLQENTNYTYVLRSYDQIEFSGNITINFTTGKTPSFSNESVPSTGTTNTAFNIDIEVDVGMSNVSMINVTIRDPNSASSTYSMTLSSGNIYRKSYTPAIAGTYSVLYYNATDEAGFSGSTTSTKTIIVSSPSSGGSSGGGGAGGGGGGGYSSPTPKPTSTLIAPGIPVALKNITSGRTQPESEAIAKCLTESLLFPNECSNVGYGIIIEIFSWWVYLGAYIGSLLVVGAVAVIKQQKREWQDVLVYGTLTVFIVAILIIVGFNLYIANYIFDSPKYAWTFISMVGWGAGLSFVVDNYTYKNARKARMNSWIAKK